MFKRIRKAAAKFLKRLAASITPKVKVTSPTGAILKVPVGDLPGNPENWINDTGLDEDLIQKSMETGSFMGHGKSDLCDILDKFAERYIRDTWKRVVTVTFFDIQRLKVAIMETEYKQLLDWFDNGGGKELFDNITELNQSYEDSIDVAKIENVNKGITDAVNSIV